MKMDSLKQPCNQIMKSLLCPQHTKYNGKFIGALLQQRDGDTSVVTIVDIGFYIKNNKNSNVAIDKTEHSRYCNS